MKRREFLRKLKNELRKRRDIEVEEVLFYYDELIQDAVDNGETEEIFIANLGGFEDIRRRIEDEEAFIIKVKNKNNMVVKDVLNKTVKVLGYFIFGVAAFSLVTTSIALFASGVAVIGVAVFGLIANTPVDTYGYLALLGTSLVGVSLIILAIAIVRWLFNDSKPSLLGIFRKINNFFYRRGI